MQQVTLENNKEEPIQMLLDYKSKSRIALFISGSGDVKDSFKPVAELLQNDETTSLASFSFRGRESDKEYPPEQQLEDLREVLDYLIKEGFTEISLMPTSMGFISVADALSNPQYTQYFKKILMLDPADYPIDMSRGTWSGCEEYKPNGKLYSSMLEQLDGDVMVDVVFFGLRNFNEGYKNRTNRERGIDNESYCSRLNMDMSQNILNSVPKNNQGEFIVDKVLPHAFSRDGDPKKNHKIIADYIRERVLI